MERLERAHALHQKLVTLLVRLDWYFGKTEVAKDRMGFRGNPVTESFVDRSFGPTERTRSETKRYLSAS